MTKMPRLGLILTLGWTTSCAPQRDTPCEKIADEVRGILEACGVTFQDYNDELGSQCTAELEDSYDCLLLCYRDASCEAIELEDPAGHEVFDDCTSACVFTD